MPGVVRGHFFVFWNRFPQKISVHSVQCSRLAGYREHITNVLFYNIDYFQDWRIRSGNWEAPELSPRQLTYAANDALVAINIFWVLLRTQFCSDLGSRFHTLNWNGPRLISECIEVVERFLDVRFSSKGWMSGARSSEKQKSTKFPSVLKLKANSFRKSPLYHNCQLQAPDGQVVMYKICTVYLCTL